MKRKKQKRTVGIYLWKIILYIIVFFAIVASVECFFLVEKTVENLISGTSGEHNSSMETDLKEKDIQPIESSDITEIDETIEALETLETSTPIISDELNKTVDEPTSNEPEPEDPVSNEPSSDGTSSNDPNSNDEPAPNDVGSIDDPIAPIAELACTESHTHIGVCYDASISDAERNEIYNLVQEIASLPEYNTLLNNLTSYVSKYNSTPSDANYNSYNTYITDINSKINSANTVAQKYKNTDNYKYIENSSKLETLVNNSGNLTKIISCNETLKSLTKWSQVTQEINSYKTSSDISGYKNYLTGISDTVKVAQQNFASQALSTDFNKYVLNYTNYESLLNVPIILECAEIIDVLPQYQGVTDKIKAYKANNNIEEDIKYLTDISSKIETQYNKFKNQKLNTSYNTYVINYDNLDKLYKMYLKEVLDFTTQIEKLPICDDVTQTILNYKENNSVTECIEYIEKSVIASNCIGVYNSLMSSTKLTQVNYTYIINYQNLKQLYDLQLERMLELIKNIEELPLPNDVNFSDSKIRSSVISTSQRYTKFIKENEQLSKYIINYDKLSELETKLTSLDKEINITVQYYAYINIIDNIAIPNEYDVRLNFIDTSGKSMPINRGNAKTNQNQLEVSPTNNDIKHIYVDDNGDVIFEKQLREVYREHKYNFSRYFEDFYVDNILSFTTFYDLLETNYQLSEIWLLNEDNPNEYITYKYTKNVYFTRNWNDKNPDAIPLTENSTIRYVYNTKEIENGVDIPVTFYDYDITSGEIFNSESDAKNNTNAKPTSTQALNKNAYARTAASGINSDANYYGKTGTRLGFGNINTGVTHNTDRWTNNGFLNTLSGPNRTGGWGTPSNSYQNCVFNIVKGIENGKLVYSEGIAAPNLFNEGEAIGKETYTDYSLKFNRTGDRYLLTQVNGTNSTNLEKLVHPHTNYPTISTNNFWPMDDVPSFGSDGHDLKFGNTNQKSYRHFVGNSNGNFPDSDNMTKDHNAYFGMRGEIEFDLSSEYVGPLEWHFYGDDDLWIFLDDQLIIDIGGVHSSVGEYANFWDYLEQGDSGHHKITFFFTERGASGSTCWMRFALPEIVASETDDTRGNLKIEKEVVGIETTEKFNFIVTLKNEEEQELNEYFYYTKYNLDGTKIRDEIFKSGDTISFSKDEYVNIEGIPANTTYLVEEITTSEFIMQSQNSTNKIVAGQTLIAKFINTYESKSLKVKKEWNNSPSFEDIPEEIQVKLVPKFAWEQSIASINEESIVLLDMDEEIEMQDNTINETTAEGYIKENNPSLELTVTLNEENGWTYSWTGLPKYRPVYDENGEVIVEKEEIEYTVKEIYTNELGEKYYAIPSYLNENGDIILTNVLYRNIEITKVDSHDKDLKLGNAEFQLDKLKEVNGEWIVDDSFETRTGTTSTKDEDLGKITFSKLKYGKYRLTEIKAPSGYNLNKKIIEIDINEDSELTIQKEIKNKKGAILPFTGGEGANVYAISGVLMVLYVYSDIRRQRAALNRKLKPKRRKVKRRPIR